MKSITASMRATVKLDESFLESPREDPSVDTDPQEQLLQEDFDCAIYFDMSIVETLDTQKCTHPPHTKLKL